MPAKGNTGSPRESLTVNCWKWDITLFVGDAWILKQINYLLLIIAGLTNLIPSTLAFVSLYLLRTIATSFVRKDIDYYKSFNYRFGHRASTRVWWVAFLRVNSISIRFFTVLMNEQEKNNGNILFYLK